MLPRTSLRWQQRRRQAQPNLRCTLSRLHPCIGLPVVAERETAAFSSLLCCPAARAHPALHEGRAACTAGRRPRSQMNGPLHIPLNEKFPSARTFEILFTRVKASCTTTRGPDAPETRMRAQEVSARDGHDCVERSESTPLVERASQTLATDLKRPHDRETRRRGPWRRDKRGEGRRCRRRRRRRSAHILPAPHLTSPTPEKAFLSAFGLAHAECR